MQIFAFWKLGFMAFMAYMFTSNAIFFFSITSFEMMIEDDEALNADFFQMPQEIHKFVFKILHFGTISSSF